jgi:hypothetical protein
VGGGHPGVGDGAKPHVGGVRDIYRGVGRSHVAWRGGGHPANGAQVTGG